MSMIRNAWTKVKKRLENYDPPGDEGPHGGPTARSTRRDAIEKASRLGPGGGDIGQANF